MNPAVQPVLSCNSAMNAVKHEADSNYIILRKIPTTGEVTEAQQTRCPILLTQDEVIDLWRTIGASKDLRTDADIAKLLLSV